MNWNYVLNAITTIASGLVLAAALWFVNGSTAGNEAKAEWDRVRPLVEQIPLMKATQDIHSKHLSDHEVRIRDCERGRCPYRGDRL